MSISRFLRHEEEYCRKVNFMNKFAQKDKKMRVIQCGSRHQREASLYPYGVGRMNPVYGKTENEFQVIFLIADIGVD